VGESVNGPQTDIKRKTCDFRNGKKIFISRHILHQHLYTCPSFYQCVETRSIKVFWLLSQPLRISVSTFSSSAKQLPSCEPLYATNISHRKQETFLYKYYLHWALLPIKAHNRTLLFVVQSSSTVAILDYWNQPLNMRMRVSYLDCHEAELWAVFLPFVTYVLTFPTKLLADGLVNYETLRWMSLKRIPVQLIGKISAPWSSIYDIR
jgi:hypothetical protein